MGTEGADFRVIAGRYRLETRIGRGGMGVVWRARDQALGRRVAVKELLPDDSLPEDDARRRRDRTFREARAVAQLRHPHVIGVYDVVEQDGRPYLIMELVDGGSLADRITRQGPVDAAEAARIGIALLSALGAAHEAGVLHRDIKPANVLIESDTGRVVLTDFGIAQVAGATTLTETGSFVGSPEYTAPERMSGLRTGPESDLWSLGALLCTALSGESPFRRDSLGGILHAVVTDEIRPPAQAEPLLPVIRGLLERDPDRRLDRADAERMLRTFLETGRTPAAPSSPGPPGSHGGGRIPRLGGGNRAPRPGAFGSRAPKSGGTEARTQRPSGPDSRSSGDAASYTPTRPDVPHGGPAPASAPQPPAERPRPSSRGVLVAALLVAALAGAGASAAVLLMHRGADGGGGTPGGTATSPATHTGAGTSPAPTVTGTSPTPTATGPEAGAPTAAESRTAPSGYRTVRDPAGFSLAVPRDFTRSWQGERVFYLSAGSTFRLGIKVTGPQPGGPEAVMNRSAADGPSTNPGYHDGRVTRTVHHGHPAALWEFTWDGFSVAEGPRHTYDLCWEEAGRMYDVWVSAPVGKVREAREYFDVAVDTFAATGG
ncbi:serine/threonine protein kinase [Streptomyces pluripotens]|uniref:non-specific serine/threonine protein kinase n=1 Tax=Streptomyces pluripotens TaxID=1355015 RepID=A0A221P9D4_9ACTN|nr:MULTISPECIES: serine/threonine-protein kinase [Streptomyces]ARP71878.1 serine/threonine protein kinase [Streptomyces pluripotens]ASN28578.1 serine/threonine protein kinase [Streptomyces pluripotens]KIE26534.1 serine/threonine protein kinase [Streptomyces sp. MUSC 125]MCH0556359.1 serine/threonine protein kinase [Streptomyces sp. MUM 16J]